MYYIVQYFTILSVLILALAIMAYMSTSIDLSFDKDNSDLKARKKLRREILIIVCIIAPIIWVYWKYLEH